MPFTTPEQFVVLAALLLGGLLIGYAIAPSPRKWKRRVREQSDSFTLYHRGAEDRLRAANQRAADLTAEAEDLRADHAAAERTIAGLRAAAVTPVVASAPVLTAESHTEAEPEPAESERIADPAPETRPVADAGTAAEPLPHGHPLASKPIDVVPMTPTPTVAAPAPVGVAEPEMPSRSWFASGARDDLTRLRGIDSVLDTRLFGLGVTRFEDLEKLSAEDEMALEQRLSLPVGYIARGQWRTQAALLRAGHDDDHAAPFGGA